MENKDYSWNIAELYRKAWEIVKEQKTLWIFGIAASAYTFGNSFRYDISENDRQNFEQFINNSASNLPKPISLISDDKISQVLGVNTETGMILNNQFNNFTQFLSTIPLSIYITLGIEIVGLILLLITISIIFKTWIEGTLISGTFIAAEGKDVSIRNSSLLTMPKLQKLLWVNVVPFTVLLVSSLVIFSMLIAGIFLAPSWYKALFGFGFVFAFGAFIYWLIFFQMAQVWAQREVISTKSEAQKAFTTSYKISQKKFFPMILLAILNNIIYSLAIGVPVVIFIGIVMSFLQIPQLKYTLIILIPFFSLLFIAGLILLPGILTAFKAATWTLAYKSIKPLFKENL